MHMSRVALLLCLWSVHCGIDYNFLEIGTSNFETLAENEKPPGLSVEALKMYQDDLPNRLGIEKINAAVLSKEEAASKTHVPFYYVDKKDIMNRTYNLPAWLKGCNSAYHPHAEASQQLKERSLEHLMKKSEVPVTSYTQLLKKINSVRIVKLDMEGFEFPVLEEMIENCNQVCPTMLKFESEWMIRLNYVRFQHILFALREKFECHVRGQDTMCSAKTNKIWISLISMMSVVMGIGISIGIWIRIKKHRRYQRLRTEEIESTDSRD